MGAAGKVPVFRALVQQLAIGDWHMGPFEAMVLNKSALDDFPLGPLAGSIGFRELIHYAWMVDYEAGKLKLWQNFEADAHEVTASMRCQYYSHLPVVEMQLGEVRLKLLLDTGCSDLVLDEGARAKAEAYLSGLQSGELMGAGGNQSAAELGSVGPLELAGIEIGHSPVTVANLAPLKARLGEFDGIIGYPLLKAVRTVVCWERKRLYFLK